jgi:hypothetical protein
MGDNPIYQAYTTARDFLDRAPRPPGMIRKVNYLLDFMHDPCGAPWVCYFECALPALGQFLLVFLDFDAIDVIRAFARPGGIYAKGLRKRGKRGKKGKGGIPDLNELIGKKIPGNTVLAARKVSQGTKALWIVDGLIQKALWYWLLIDATSDFLYSWTSLVNKTVYCQLDRYSSVSSEGNCSPFLGLSGWMPVNAPNVIRQRHLISWSPGVVSCLDVPATFSAGARITNIGWTDFTFEMKLTNGQDPETILGYTSTGSLSPGNSSDACLSCPITTPGVYGLWGKISTGFGETSQEIIFCQASGPWAPADPHL